MCQGAHFDDHGDYDWGRCVTACNLWWVQWVCDVYLAQVEGVAG